MQRAAAQETTQTYSEVGNVGLKRKGVWETVKTTKRETLTDEEDAEMTDRVKEDR